MSTYNNEGDSPDYPSWNWKESDWQKFLVISDTQVRQFIAYYHLLLDDPMRLDKVAEQMGWVAASWQSPDTEELDDEDDGPEASADDGPEDELPFTLHLHPIYVVTRGVFKSLYELSMAFAKLNNQNTLLQLATLSTLHEAETQAILGIESQDMGDMALTVCHFKRSLMQLNHAMAMLDRMVAEKLEGAALYSREARKRIFDLREVWLRVNSEVRQEIQRRNDKDGSK